MSEGGTMESNQTGVSSLRPVVSIIILNYNGKSVIKACVDSVLRSDYSPLQLIMVDNGSTDSSTKDCIASLNEYDQERIRVIYNTTNLGYCDGFNCALPYSVGKYVMFLNNDVEIDPTSITKLVEIFERDDDVGMAEGKIINITPGGPLKVASPYVSFKYGLFVDVFQPNPDVSAYDEVRDIFSPVGVWAICRRSVLDYSGSLDSVIFHGIDVRELSWRFWRTGFKVVRVPEAVTLHHARLSTGLKSYSSKTLMLLSFHAKKNHFYFMMKHLSMKRIIVYFPLILGGEIIAAFGGLFGHNKYQFRVLVSSLKWTFANLPAILEQRKMMFSKSKISESQVFSHLPKVPFASALLEVLRLNRND